MLHILGLARNLISISKMGDAGVRTVFEKDTCKMVRGTMVLMQGIRIGTLYKLLGRTEGCSCHQMVDPKIDENLSCVANLTMLWY